MKFLMREGFGKVSATVILLLMALNVLLASMAICSAMSTNQVPTSDAVTSPAIAAFKAADNLPAQAPVRIPIPPPVNLVQEASRLGYSLVPVPPQTGPWAIPAEMQPPVSVWVECPLPWGVTGLVYRASQPGGTGAVFVALYNASNTPGPVWPQDPTPRALVPPGYYWALTNSGTNLLPTAMQLYRTPALFTTDPPCTNSF
jgi:hypothetical protein